MASAKRKIADKVGRIFGVSIMRPAVMQQTISGNLQKAVEQYNLSRFLRHFEVDCVFDVGANYGQYAELELASHADPQQILHRLVASGARLSKFELQEASLNKIFIDLVGPDAARAEVRPDA